MNKDSCGTSCVPAFPPEHKFNGIDLVKFLCALAICISHIPLLPSGFPHADGLNYWVQECACRIAVPFFFASSGFLLFRKTELCHPDAARIKNYELKNIRLLGIWTILLFTGYRYHLWFMGALAVAVAIVGFLLYKGVRMRFIVLLSLAAYAIGLLGDSYSGLLEPLTRNTLVNFILETYKRFFESTRNGFFFGLIFVLMGALLSHARIRLNLKVAFLGFAVSFAAMFGEAYLLRRYLDSVDYNMLVTLLPTTFFLFCLAANVQLKDRPIYADLRAVGLIVYFAHLAVDAFVLWLIDVANLFGLRVGIVRLPLVLCLTIALAFLIRRLSETPKMRWLRFLYS